VHKVISSRRGRLTKLFSWLHTKNLSTANYVLGVIITHALMLWKLWICLSGSGSPVVVVLTGSMEPGFRKGDVLFLYMNDSPIRSGEIVVFQVEGRDIPIVHRAIMVLYKLLFHIELFPYRSINVGMGMNSTFSQKVTIILWMTDMAYMLTVNCGLKGII
ncbi:hypothetical protein RJ640_020833, partial [Escallonia rubra]